MSYKITIERTRDEVQVCGKDWKEIDSVEYKSDYGDCGVGIKSVMGYTPEIEKTVTVTEKVYEQIVGELDLADVVAVINNPKKVLTVADVTLCANK